MIYMFEGVGVVLVIFFINNEVDFNVLERYV